jgi:hypothetical protein
MNMSTANNSSLIVEQLITYADWFFPGEVDFDRDLDIGIMNDAENQSVDMRRCMSNSSLSDHGESPTQGSPKPAARRKNKPAPTPPGGNTSDRHEKREDKPPPTPDKPPRILTSTLNRVSAYKVQKHEVDTELIRHESNIEKHDKHLEMDTKLMSELISMDLHSIDNSERSQETHQSEASSSGEADVRANITGAKEKSNDSIVDNIVKSITDNIIEHGDVVIQKSKPVSTEKPTTLERRRPVAAPRSITNITHSTGANLYQILFYLCIRLY